MYEWDDLNHSFLMSIPDNVFPAKELLFFKRWTIKMTSCSHSHLNSRDLTLASIPTPHVFLNLEAMVQVLLESVYLGD